jgi:alpha-L-arabinofuranosidase
MANLAQLVNVLPAIVTDDKGRIYVNPTYLAFKLYMDHTGAKALRTEAFSDTYRSGKYGLDQVPYLDASASLGPGMLHLALVNRSKGNDLNAVIKLRNAKARTGGAVSELNGERPDSFNSFEDPKAVAIRRRSLRQSGSTIELLLRAHSSAIVDLPVG